MEWFPAVEMLLTAIVGVLLTIGGLAIEFLAVNQLIVGEFITGGWMVAVGAIALIGGLRLLDQGVLSFVRERR